jgi:hypothetical protein
MKGEPEASFLVSRKFPLVFATNVSAPHRAVILALPSIVVDVDRIEERQFSVDAAELAAWFPGGPWSSAVDFRHCSLQELWWATVTR